MNFNTEYDITVIIQQYNPSWDRLCMTLNSVIIQKGIKVCIIISDDGSKTNFKEEIEEYLKDKNCELVIFRNYEENEGTAKSIYKSLGSVNTEYVKVLSPGDMLYGEYSLRDFHNFCRSNGLAVGLSYLIAYQNIEGEINPVRYRRQPQCIKYKSGEDLKRQYLYFSDLCCGAAVMYNTESLRKNLKKVIDGGVKFAEDQNIRLAVFNDEKVDMYKTETVLYEIGTGISTSSENKWEKILLKEHEAVTNIMMKTDPAKYEKYKRTGEPICRGDGISKALLKFIKSPRFNLRIIRTGLFPAMTRVHNIDTDYIVQLGK